MLTPAPRNFLHSKWTYGLLLALLLACSAILRYGDLSAPLLDFHPTRQLFSAVKARGIYFQSLSDVPAWQKDLAIRQYENEATIEPPIMEHVAAWLYQYFGETTAIPRAISSSIWMLGGLFLFLLSKNLNKSNPAAFFGLAFYLLLPYAISASRAFQPDPLMISLIIIFWWSMENWGRNSSWKWTFVAGISGGLAILVKFPAVFFIIGAAIGVIIAYDGIIHALKKPQTWILMFIGLLPPTAYLYYGTYIAKFLGQQFNGRIYPELWISPFFYLRWFLKLEHVINVPWLMLALLGCVIFSNKNVKIFLGSLTVSYLIYGITFAHHISSHDYYSLPAIPLVALCISQSALALSKVFDPAIHPSTPADKQIPAISLQLFYISLLSGSIVLIALAQYTQQRTNDYRQQADFWQNVGNATGHQPGVIALTTDYGYPLAYYGWQNSSLWPASVNIQDYDETFTQLIKNKDYFLITDFQEYQHQPELKERLENKFPVLSQGTGYLIFDLGHPIK